MCTTESICFIYYKRLDASAKLATSYLTNRPWPSAHNSRRVRAAEAEGATAEIGESAAGSLPVRDHSESPCYLHNTARAPITPELPRGEERGPIGLRRHPVQTDAPHQGGPRTVE